MTDGTCCQLSLIFCSMICSNDTCAWERDCEIDYEIDYEMAHVFGVWLLSRRSSMRCCDVAIFLIPVMIGGTWS